MRVPLQDGAGNMLADKRGQIFYQWAEWDLLHDENGCPQYNEAGELCFERRKVADTEWQMCPQKMRDDAAQWQKTWDEQQKAWDAEAKHRDEEMQVQ